MTTNARNVHRRIQSLPRVGAEVSRKKSDKSESVPVHFNPENPPHEDFKNFYPLHVTRVATSKPLSPTIVIVGAVAVIIVAAAAGLYILAQQEKNHTTSMSSSQPLTNTITSSVTPTSDVAASQAAVGTVGQNTDGTMLYTNASYGFSLILPKSWQGIQTRLVKDDVKAQATKSVATIQFTLPDEAKNPYVLLELRVDSADSYPTWVSELTKNNVSASPKIGETGSRVISATYTAKDLATPPTQSNLVAAIADVSSVTSSFQKTTQ